MRLLSVAGLTALLVVLVADSSAFAQRRAYPYGPSGFGVGVGVGVGYGPGPYWGPGFGPGWAYPGFGWMPNYYQGTWGNGLSMYGPPVPTHKPVPGAFGGGDSRYFGLPPYYGTSWLYYERIPLTKPAPLPAQVLDAPPQEGLPAPQEVLPVPKPASGAVELEVRLPTEDAVLYIDGAATKTTGRVRQFNSPPIDGNTTYTYELRAEWKVDGLTHTHSRRVTVKAGDRKAVTLGD